MRHSPLGNTGLQVSEIGFGCGNVGGLMIRGEHTDQVKAVARAIELGINYFDTAPSYGDGQSEANLGKVLREMSADVHVGTNITDPLTTVAEMWNRCHSAAGQTAGS